MSDRTLIGLVCIRCGAPTGDTYFHAGCPACASKGTPTNLRTAYDLQKARPSFEPEALSRRPRGMWRYDALLPFGVDEAVTLGEGGTPLVTAPRLAKRLGLRAVWIKDESRNPTWSFKDRGNSVAATHARRLGCRALVVSSTGNAAAATAAYGRRAGIPAIVFVAKSVDPIMSGFVQSYRPYLVMAPTKADRWVMMKHCVEAWNCYPTGNYVTPPLGGGPYMIAGYKTIGFEIWERLGRRAPDWIFGPSGYSDWLAGVYQGFRELEAMDLAGVPRLGAAEAYGSLSRALEEGGDTLQPANTDRPTVAFSIATAQNAYQGLDAVRGSGGTATRVDNGGILAAQELLVETEGIFGETASAAGLAALIREIDEGRVERDAEVVILLTSTGLKSMGVTGVLEAAVPLAKDVADLASILRTTYGFDTGAV